MRGGSIATYSFVSGWRSSPLQYYAWGDGSDRADSPRTGGMTGGNRRAGTGTDAGRIATVGTDGRTRDGIGRAERRVGTDGRRIGIDGGRRADRNCVGVPGIQIA